MPSSPNYKRDHKQELRTQKRRGEDAKKRKRMKDRREYEKKNGKIPAGKELDHKGGINGKTRVISKSANRSAGGKVGNKAGKAAGARKGHASRRKKTGAALFEGTAKKRMIRKLTPKSKAVKKKVRKPTKRSR